MLIGETAAVRRRVLHAAREGRATLLPAGARDNDTALIFIDDEEIGQASTYAHYVREATPDESATATPGRKYSPFTRRARSRTFATRRLRPKPDWNLPPELRS